MSKYGVWVAHCLCGWTNVSKRQPELKVDVCEACLQPIKEATFDEQVACWAMTVTHKRDERIGEIARRHGLMLYQMSPRKFLLMTAGSGNVVRYGSGEKDTLDARAYIEVVKVYGPASYQEVMKYLRENTPALPDYLRK